MRVARTSPAGMAKVAPEKKIVGQDMELQIKWEQPEQTMGWQADLGFEQREREERIKQTRMP